jgi:acyl carrier protein
MKEKFINAFAEALEMDVTLIRESDNFRDYENYSSLSELGVLAMLDSEFGIEIEMREFNKYKTIGDLLQLITARSAK